MPIVSQSSLDTVLFMQVVVCSLLRSRLCVCVSLNSAVIMVWEGVMLSARTTSCAQSCKCTGRSTVRFNTTALHQFHILAVLRLCTKVSQEVTCVECIFLNADYSCELITFTTKRQQCCKYDHTRSQPFLLYLDAESATAALRSQIQEGRSPAQEHQGSAD